MKTAHTFVIFAALCLAPGAHAAIALWTTTFTDNSAGANTDRAMANAPAAPFTDNLSATWSLTRSGSASPIFLTGTDNNANNFNPNQNVDNAAGAFWQADFAFTGGTATIDLQGATFNIYRYNNGGNMQTADTLLRTVDFSAWYTTDGGTNWTPIGATQNVNTTASHTTNSPDNLFIPLSFALPALSAVNLGTADFGIRFRAENDATNSGANIGINSFTVNTIPEPTAALLGALGLLGLMRRRR